MIYEVKNMIDGQPTFEKPLEVMLIEFKQSLLSCNHGEAVEAIKHDSRSCISKKQNGWLHCKEGPIMYLVGDGWDFYEAKRFLKVKYGRKIFVRDMTNENCTKAKGVFFWECRLAKCRKIVHPQGVIINDNRRLCPDCHSKLFPIIIKSINQVAPSRIKVWNESIWEAYPLIKKPDPEWYKNEK